MCAGVAGGAGDFDSVDSGCGDFDCESECSWPSEVARAALEEFCAVAVMNPEDAISAIKVSLQ